ncbi:hypothetical protein Spb1_29810 [Planctopirus ephydatiae]|uniref:Uncharacterized protein n=2 Tax=Planctopirus ephydatiae TaxID=2528019 RepID=A0A518GR32_9PLAN|nr:hypothetical protein Spb1_29810 [Planctopirus ephydatiae]
MTNPPKRPLAHDDDSWGKLASDLFGIEFGVDDELDLPDPDELNESIPAAATLPQEEPIIDTPSVTDLPAPASPVPARRKKVIDDAFGSDLFDSDIEEEAEEFEAVAEVREVSPARPEPAPRASQKASVTKETTSRVETTSSELDEDELEDVPSTDEFPMTIAEQGDDYWDALESWNWDEPQGKSRDSRPKDLLKTLEAEVARNSRQARELADPHAAEKRGRRSASRDTGGESERSGRPSSSAASGDRRSERKAGTREGTPHERRPRSAEAHSGAADSSSGGPRSKAPRDDSYPPSSQPRQRRVAEERLPTTERAAYQSANDDEFGSGLSESAGTSERSPSRRPPRPVSQPRRPVPLDALAEDDELDDVTEIDDVAFVAESSENSEEGEVRRRRRRRRRRRPGNRPGETSRDPLVAEEFGTDSDELEEHLEDSRTLDPDEPELELSERERPAPRTEKNSADKPVRDRSRRDRSPRRTADERTDRPARPPRAESARSESPRVKKENDPVIGDRDNEFVDEPRHRSRRPVSDENYTERSPRDLEVPPSRRPVAAVSQTVDEASQDPVTPANYDDIPTWEEAIGMLVKTPASTEGDRSSRPRRDDHRRGDRYRS